MLRCVENLNNPINYLLEILICSIGSRQVHQTSKSVGYRRNFSSPAGDGKEPKKRSAVKSFVTQSLVAATLGAITGLYVGTSSERERT
ncbi:hypothetical protein YC2023_006725 [Brassica napus]